MELPSNVIQAVKQPKVFLRDGSGQAKPIEVVPAKVKIELVKVDLTPHQKTLARDQPKYPFDLLKPPPSPDQYYSFFMPCSENEDFKKFRGRMAVVAAYYTKRSKGKARYATRSVVQEGVQGVRIMRVK